MDRSIGEVFAQPDKYEQEADVIIVASLTKLK